MRKSALLALFALGSLTLSARPALANDVNPYSYANDPRWQYVSSDSICEPDGFSKMLPFSLNKDMAEPVDDIATSTYLLNILPFGGLWGPLVTLPNDHPDMGAGDVVLSYMAPYCGGFVTSWVFSWTGIGWFAGMFAACYNAPTAALNGWDRAYRCGGKKPGKKGTAPKTKPKAESGGDEGYAY